MIAWEYGEVGGWEEGVQGDFGGDRYYLQCGDSFQGVDLCQNLSSGTLYTYAVDCVNYILIKPFKKT